MPSQVIEVSGDSLEAARADLRRKVPQGQSVLSENVISDGKEKRLEGVGKTPEAAFQAIESQLPKGATVTTKRVVKAHQEKTYSLVAQDEPGARSSLARQMNKTDLVLSIKPTTPGRSGFLGIGKRLPEFQAQVLEQAVVELKYKLAVRLTAAIGYKNRGDLHDTLSKASSYWVARISLPRKDPFVMYTFTEEPAARRALLELPCIHEGDDGRLICTEIFIFGVYCRDDGIYEAVIGGDDLTVELWEQAKAAFERHGGKRKNDLKPAKHAPASCSVAHTAVEVVFVREDRTENPTAIYRVHRGPDAYSAKAFLDSNPVDRPLYYLVVETPEGVFCRDQSGFYKE